MHGAESIILHQDLIRLGPLFFEQGQNTYRCSVLCSKNTSVYTSLDAQFVRVFRTSHGFLFSGKRLSPFSFLNSLLIFSTSTFSHRAQNLDSCTPKLGAHVCSSCIRLLQGVSLGCLTQIHTCCHNLPPEEIDRNTRPVSRSLAVN